MIYYALLLLQLILLSFFGRRNVQVVFHSLRRITHSTPVSFYTISLLYFPGTLVHELSHLFTSIALFVQPTNISFIPTITETHNQYSVRLGYVQHRHTDPLRSFLIGISPFFVGCAFFYLIQKLNLFPYSTWQGSIFLLYLFFTISSTMFPSKQDLQEILVLLPIMFVATVLIISFDIPVVNYLLTDDTVDTVRQINTYLALGTGTNGLVYFLFRFLLRSR